MVRGVVQGVGFRPFVFCLAERHGLSGEVCNTSGAVLIEIEGPPGAVDAFSMALEREAPPLARIDGITADDIPAAGDATFRIVESRSVAGEYQPISPDAGTCDACLRELLDPADRRHRYPFLNCTDCGPRFTIIEELPYDRPLTTMRAFTMCALCQAEYEDPRNRRFHAQPNACRLCGPRLWLADTAGSERAGDAIALAAALLCDGGIVALRGMGGFQLACDAGDEAAVARLRTRKRRPAKPFAVMVVDVAAARLLCEISDAEAAALLQPARPVVLLRRRADAPMAPGVAPGLDELGLLLPSTPLHHLLLRDAGRPLVMTSGNLSEEPIARDNDEALARLGGIADALLLHDRGIAARYDDSVVRVVGGEQRMIRRARGFAPLPVAVAGRAPQILAVGAHLKNTFTVLRDGRAFVGPHIGELDSPLTLEHQAETLRAYLRLFRCAPDRVVADLHPDYASTALAEAWWEQGAAVVRVQHHHAHIASVMAEHALRGPVLGIAFDGVGLGPDGTLWGGEILVCDERGYERRGHIASVRQPGGDACAREGWRMAAAYLAATGRGSESVPRWMDGEAAGELPADRSWRLVSRLSVSDIAPVSTSAGRLFDAVASVLGVAHRSSYEAEAAIRLEAVARAAHAAGVEALPVTLAGDPLVLDTPALVAALADRRAAGVDGAELAAVFHESLAVAVAEACIQLARQTGIRRAALSGGVFQNTLLSTRVADLLRERGLDVYTNRAVPANDGGISLGQALVGAATAPHEEVA